MNITSARLADGREIIFFDTQPTARHVHDPRDLDPRAGGSQLRRDQLTGEWTAIAAHRQTRTYLPPADECPLCPSRDGRHSEVPVDAYDIVVFENRFPSFDLLGPDAASRLPFESQPGRGRCEVVVFTSDHDRSFVDLSPERVEDVLRVLASRTAALGSLDEIAYVYCFENRGAEIGVTLQHPHGQIYALPIVPPRIAALAAAASKHRERTGECVQCDVLSAELQVGERIITASKHWVSYVPFAARWPYEIRVVPRRHIGDLTALDDVELADLAYVYQDALARLDALDPAAPVPYIAGWLQAPVGVQDWHCAAEIFTIRRGPQRLKYLAGIESGVALWINDIAPEAAAGHLRAVTS